MTTSNSTEANKALVLEGIKGVFINRDPTVLDRLFSPDYRQHNPQIPNGTAAIRGLLGNLSSDLKYEPGLVLAEGDYVSIHGRYIGWGRRALGRHAGRGPGRPERQRQQHDYRVLRPVPFETPG
jgi:SnoaL-like domain